MHVRVRADGAEDAGGVGAGNLQGDVAVAITGAFDARPRAIQAALSQSCLAFKVSEADV